MNITFDLSPVFLLLLVLCFNNINRVLLIDTASHRLDSVTCSGNDFYFIVENVHAMCLLVERVIYLFKWLTRGICRVLM